MKPLFKLTSILFAAGCLAAQADPLAVTAINRLSPLDPNYTLGDAGANTVTFEVIFNQDALNVAAGVFTLTPSGACSANVASVTSVSPSVYDVVVNNISGDGSLRLDLLSNSGVTDTASNPLAGDFTTGQAYTFVKSTATVDLASLSQTYDGTPKSATASTTPSGLTVSITYGGSLSPPTSAGSYQVVATISDENFSGTASGTLSIAPAPLTVTAVNQSWPYGFPNPVFTLSYSGFVNNEDAAAAFTVLPSASIAANTTAGITNRPGSYAITAAGGTAPNYTLTYAPGTLTVTKAPLTISIASAGRPYGQPNPVLTPDITGEVAGDNITATPTTTATDTSLPGIYAINLSMNDPLNKLGFYTLSLQSGNLTVTKASLTGQVQSQSRSYGQANAAFAVVYSGFVLGQNESVLSGALNYTCVDGSGSAVGPATTVGVYPIHVTTGQTAANYTVVYQDGALNVTKATLTVLADSITRLYGASNPSFTASYFGFVNGEDTSVLSGTLSFSTAAETGSSVGSYTIIPAGLGSPNYNIVYKDAPLTINPAPLTVTATNVDRVYGQPNPDLGGSLLGVVNADNLTATFASAATAESAVGHYSIYPVFADPGTKLGNYNVTTNLGDLQVKAAQLTAKADSFSRAYGETNPVLTLSYSGFANSDSASIISGTANLATTAETNSPVGTYDITVDIAPLSAPNYTFTAVNGQLTVTQAVLLVTADNQSRLFGDTNPVLTATITGFVNDETKSVLTGDPLLTCVANSSSPVGAYDIVPELGTLSAANYSFIFSNGTLTVGQALLSVIADNQQRSYGAANPILTSHYSGFMPGDDASIVLGAPVLNTTADVTSPVGNYDITIAQGTLSAANYAFVFSNASLKIDPAPLTVTADNQSRTYGVANPAFTGTDSGAQNNDNLGLSFSSSATAASPVGGYDIVPAFADPDGRLANYSITTNIGTLTVQAAPLTVAVDSATKVYGAPIPTLSGSIAGVVNNDNLTATFTTTATASTSVGSYSIVPVFNDLDVLTNYTVTTNAGSLNITPAQLTVTAGSASRFYGYPNPAPALQYSGFVAGDDASALTTAPTASCSADASSWLGTYPIVPAGGASPNYTFAYVNGTLTITKAPLVVSGPDVSRPYGAANPVFTAEIDGLVNGQQITAALASTASPTDPPGQYPINMQISDPDGVLGAYDLMLLSGTLTITPASLVGQVQNTAKSYGDTNPVFSVNYTGWVNGEDSSLLAGTVSYSCIDPSCGFEVNTNTAVGTYSVQVISGQQAPNYTIHYVSGSISIAAAPLLVTPDPKSRLYGDTNPVLTATITGFVNGDTTNNITGAPVLSTTADVSSPIGAYDIVAELGTLGATNYFFNLTNGTLTVGKALLSVIAENQTRTYGAANPELTYRYSGFVSGDTAAILSGQPAISATADAATPVGTYDITITQGTLTAANYALGFSNASLKIDPAPLTVTADNQTRTYGAANPVFTLSFSGFVNGEDSAALSALPAISTEAAADSSPATYAIVLSGGSAQNYALTLVNGQLQVTKAPLVATAANHTRVYGADNPTLNIDYTGFVNGEDASVLLTPPAAATTAAPASSVAEYPITLSGGTDPNYELTLVNGTLSVTPAQLTVTAQSLVRGYGTANPPLNLVFSGFVNHEDQGVLDVLPSLSSSAAIGSPVGIYAINITGGSALNYILTLNPGTLTVLPAPLSVAANSYVRAFGMPDPVLTGTITGVMNGDNLTPTYTCEATASSPGGTYTIAAGLNDPTGVSANYAITLANGTLTITGLELSTNAGLYVIGNDPVPLDTNAVVSGGSLTFAGGTLTISSVTNAVAEDLLTVLNAGQIAVQNGTVTFAGNEFATFAGGAGAAPMVFTLNASASADALTALLRQVTFATTSTNTGLRIFQVDLAYGGAVASAQRQFVLNRPPVAADDEITVVKGQTLTLPFSLFLANDTDLDSDTLTVSSTSGVSAYGGLLTTVGSALKYSPSAGALAAGHDLFAYLVDDGRGGDAVGVVTLKFIAANRLQLDLSALQTTGARIQLGGSPGKTYQVQASSDLENWTTLNTVTASATGVIEVFDANAKDFANRYYRALPQ